MNVCITGAGGNIAYSLYNLIGQGLVFGKECRVNLRLLEVSSKLQYLKAIVLQLEDACYGNIAEIVATDNLQVAFSEADFVIFLGGQPRRPGQERRDLYRENGQIFKEHGVALDQYAKQSCKCLVVTNPVNLMCYTLAKHCKKIPKENFTCLMRLDYNRAVCQLAKKIKCLPADIQDVVVWGNHSLTQFPDATAATVQGRAVTALVEREWLEGPFKENVQLRGSQILRKKKASTVVSAAKAIMDHVVDWREGSSNVVTMGVITTEAVYGLGVGICISLPTECLGGYTFRIKKDFSLCQSQIESLKKSEQQILFERTLVDAEDE